MRLVWEVLRERHDVVRLELRRGKEPTCELGDLHGQLLDQPLCVRLPLVREGGVVCSRSDTRDLDGVRIPSVLDAGRDERHVDVRLDAFGAGGIPLPSFVVRVLGLDGWACSSTARASGGLFLAV